MTAAETTVGTPSGISTSVRTRPWQREPSVEGQREDEPQADLQNERERDDDQGVPERGTENVRGQQGAIAPERREAPVQGRAQRQPHGLDDRRRGQDEEVGHERQGEPHLEPVET